jgi:KUP system potassium uptake protein
MVNNKELSITSHYESLKKYNLMADFQFVILEKFLSYNNEFTTSEGFILHTYFRIKKFALTEAQAFGLDTSETKVECLPLVFKPIKVNLNRISYK